MAITKPVSGSYFIPTKRPIPVKIQLSSPVTVVGVTQHVHCAAITATTKTATRRMAEDTGGKGGASREAER